MAKKELKMTFDPNTIEHLGVRMYSTLPPVLIELIANSHDADAEHVLLTLDDDSKEKQIIIEDDGIGMSFDEINNKFLRIGRNRRIDDKEKTTPKGRKIIGKKGLGKLSFFGIAQEIEITTKKEGKENAFLMSWKTIKESGKEYKPKILKNDEACPSVAHGTKIILRKIQRESDFFPEDIANSLSKMFIIDVDFEIKIRHNKEDPILVTNERRFSGLEKEVEWKIPDDLEYKDDYEKSNQIVGYLMTTKKPIPPNTNLRGITLFSRKKLVNLPEYFSDSTSSHFFSYLTGWLEVDFIDDLEIDVIATNRQSLNWGHEEMHKLKKHLRGLINWLERDWHNKRGKIKEKRLSESTGIDISSWFSKLPDDIHVKVRNIVTAIVRESELPDEINQLAVKNIHEIIPEYPRYHWRNLHQVVKSVSRKYYENQDYYTAFFESVKAYVTAVENKTKSGPDLKERDLLSKTFRHRNPILSVTEGYKKPDGNNFAKETIINIDEGHRQFVLGVWDGCRHPIAHEEASDLRDSGLFIEKDCLDALSLLSHLFRRLDNAKKIITTI